MHAVQSALAVKRERERRQSLKDRQNPRRASGASISANRTGIPSDFKSSESSNGSFNYTTVGVSFIIFGSLMMIPIMAGSPEFAGMDWRHLLGIGGLLIAIGVLMIVVNLLTDDDSSIVEQTMEKYKAKMARSGSQNPIIEDVEYGLDSRRNSTTAPVGAPEIAKNFDHQQDPGGVVKV